MTPLRIRLSRAKGWRMPENTVKVDRTTELGNPFRVGIDGARRECVHLHRALIAGLLSLTSKATIEEQRAHNHAVHAAIPHMRGKNLACWCSLPAPGEPDLCHAATLLEIFNDSQEPPQ
ncbi:DUF4326 domain-containing protein [Acidocella sp.]|uniref:DUF4326 domain-containing protein n=1 Tax=Acidocella sp. TaxID=50710 RepID=UPI0026286E85|nr:DUF4326 domain-containing protein [Acidocella sp.]